MTLINPYIEIPYPDFALEEVTAPNQVRPVAEVSATTAARALEARQERPAGAADAMEVSVAARNLAAESTGQTIVADQELRNRDLASKRIRNNLSIRDLIASFDNYDNRIAQERFNNYLRLFVGFAANPASLQKENSAMAEVRNGENRLYAALGFLPPNISGEGSLVAQQMALAIDKWLKGSGVFLPSMLSYSSSDGFRFTPLSTASQSALRAADTFATYERWRIAQYLRETATLTPEDFMFYDPTGLGGLMLRERRMFLQRMNQIFEQARVNARAADMRYSFDEAGRLALSELDLGRDELLRLEAFADVINSYYSMLLGSVKQYKAGIVSVGLSPTV